MGFEPGKIACLKHRHSGLCRTVRRSSSNRSQNSTSNRLGSCSRHSAEHAQWLNRETSASVSLNQQVLIHICILQIKQVASWLFFSSELMYEISVKKQNWCFVFTIWSRAKHKKQVQKAQCGHYPDVASSCLCFSQVTFWSHFTSNWNQNSDESMLDTVSELFLLRCFYTSDWCFHHIGSMSPSARHHQDNRHDTLKQKRQSQKDNNKPCAWTKDIIISLTWR